MAKKKRLVEEIYDFHAEKYSELDSLPSKYPQGRTAYWFADAISWHFLRKYAPKKKSAKLLDAGAGDGYWSEKFARLGYSDLTLTDISKRMLGQAKKRLMKTPAKSGGGPGRIAPKTSIRFLKADISDMKALPSSSFDFVFSQYDPVSYCMRPQKAMNELARVAKPCAHICVMVDTKYRRVSEFIACGRIGDAEKLLKNGVSHDFHHPQINFTYQELSKYFKNAGLEVKEVIGAPVFAHQIAPGALKGLEAGKKAKARMLTLELEHCTDLSLVNFAGHLQIVGRKPEHSR